MTEEAKIVLLIDKYRLINRLYIEMYNTYVRQKKAFDEDKTEQANKMISKRGKLIKKIDRLNEQIKRVKNDIQKELGIDEVNFTNLKGKISSENLNMLKQETSKTKSLLEKMIKIDEQIINSYKKEYNFIKGKIKNLKKNKKAVKAYKVNQNHSKFVDKKK